MLRLNVVACALLFCTDLYAGCWSDDRVTQGLIISSNALTLVDWRQTRYIARHPDEYREVGPAAKVIGEHPTKEAVNRYFLRSMVLNNAIGCLLPEHFKIGDLELNPKKLFYIGVSVQEAYYVQNNIEIGIQTDF